MIRWALAFAILALVAGVLGFGNMAGDFALIAKILPTRHSRNQIGLTT
jgi:uncharacterized membrane protein YtjA (UPF0391 family)